jgi:hypothetical protein
MTACPKSMILVMSDVAIKNLHFEYMQRTEEKHYMGEI